MTKKTKINLVYSTHLSPEENLKFEEHIIETSGVNTTIYKYTNYNQYSLSEVYNLAINDISRKSKGDEITIFAHNDIEIDTPNWGRKLLNHFNSPSSDFQIIGVAGVESLYSGCWWLKNNQMNINEMIGIVNHQNQVRKWESKYSESFFGIKPVTVIDGLFMAVDLDDIEHKFDERFGMWHFYDMGFVFKNVLDGCNAGVITDVRITHKSIGQTDKEWEENKVLFEKIYENELPFKIKDYL